MVVTKGTILYKRFIIPYRTFGTGKTSLLCINGAQMTMGTWKQFIKRFSNKYRVVLFDFPHQGAGEILTGPYFISFSEQLECIKQVINHVPGFDELYVVGVSWGATVAMTYAAQNPGKVKKQIIGSCALKSNEKLDALINKGIDYYKNEQGSRVAELLANGLGGNISDVLRRQIERQFKKINSRQAEAFYYQTCFAQQSRLEDLVDLSKITAASLLVYGDKDEICSMDDANFLQKHIKNSKLSILKDTGHFIHLENGAAMDVYEKFFASDPTSVQPAKSSTRIHSLALSASHERLTPLIPVK